MFISRRKFLGWAGLVGLTVATGEKVKAASIKHFEGYSDSLAVLHDSVLCLGCRKCEESCNSVNDLPKPKRSFSDLSVLDQKRRTTTTMYTVVNRYKPQGDDKEKTTYYKSQCNHCLEPACASACFVGALKKTREGAVTYDSSVCVGCRYCMIACPFEVPTYEYDSPFFPRIMKCNMCYSRVADGNLPGCVGACPAGALTFGKRKDLIKVARSRIDNDSSAYVDHIYGEREVGGTSWLYLSGVSFDKIGLRTDLGILPSGEFTASALGAVPMVVGLWPILLTGIYSVARRNKIIAVNEKKIAVEEAVDVVRSASEAKLARAMEDAKVSKEDAVKKAKAEIAKT